MGDLVDLYLIINSIALKYCSMTFILMAKSKIFIHRLLRTNSVVRLSSFSLNHSRQVSSQPRLHSHLRARHTSMTPTHASTHVRTCV